MAEEVSLVFEAKTDQLVTADKRLDKLNKTGMQTARVQKQVGRSFAANQSKIQNTSFQLQDIVVQLEAGVPVTRTLAQQLPQLLGGFGALGAVAGVVAGLAFSFGPLLARFTDAKIGAQSLDSALKELEDTIVLTKDGTALLSEQFEILAGKSRDVAEVQLKARLISAAAATDAAFKELSETVDDFDFRLAKSGNAVRGNANVLARLAKAYGITKDELLDLRELTKTAISTKTLEDTKELRDRVTELALSSGSTTEKFTLLAQSVNEATSQLESTSEITGLLKTSLEDLDGALIVSGETTTEALAKQAEERRRLAEDVEENERRLTLFFQNEEQKRLVAAEREAKKRQQLEERAQTIKEIQRKRDIQSATSFTERSLNIIAEGAKEGSALAKAAFVASQAVSIAKMIVDTEAAATAALNAGGPFAGPALSGLIRGLGYASVGIAAGQTIANVSGGRAQGGQVRQGQAYTVGEFGPETFVPSSTGRILPSNQAANDVMRPVEVVNNIRVIGGNSNSQVTTQTTQQSDRRVIQDIVVDLMSNQSSPARQALHRTSNVTPRGQR